MARLAGEQMPVGWVVDPDGKPITDPARADEGFLVPIGGYKGSGLTMAIGLLAGTLNGAAFGRSVVDHRADQVTPTNTGQLLIAFKADLFRPLADVLADVTGRLDELRAADPLDGTAVRLPGDRAAEAWETHLRDGLEVEPQVLAGLLARAAELGTPTARPAGPAPTWRRADEAGDLRAPRPHRDRRPRRRRRGPARRRPAGHDGRAGGAGRRRRWPGPLWSSSRASPSRCPTYDCWRRCGRATTSCASARTTSTTPRSSPGSGFDASQKQAVPDHPIVFTKALSSVIAPGDPIDVSADVTGTSDYEGELAVVIGRGGRGIAAADAFDHVYGYTIVNDLTVRELQKRHVQFFLGKSAATYCPMGPALVTRDEVDDVRALWVRTSVNGEERQAAPVADLIFDIPTLIETISASVLLEPGDMIATGTPAGVGIGFTPPRYLRPGDVVEVTVDGLGTLFNPTV